MVLYDLVPILFSYISHVTSQQKWNCYLQNWLQKLSLEEIVTARDFFSYNKETDGMSKHQF